MLIVSYTPRYYSKSSDPPTEKDKTIFEAASVSGVEALRFTVQGLGSKHCTLKACLDTSGLRAP